MIKRDKRHVGKTVIYLLPHPRQGRTVKVTGFRGDCMEGVPYVTLTDGNTVAGHLIKRVKEKTND